jgi:hypothetical protein
MEKIDAEKEIKEIKSMLKETEDEIKKVSVYRADYSIMWGTIVIIGLLINMLLSRFELYIWVFIMWILVLISGWSFSHIISRREYRQTGIITFVGKIETVIWVATSIGILLVILFGWFSELFNPILIPTIVAILAGNAFFISSFLFSDKILKFSSPIWWIGAILSVIYPGIIFYIFIVLIFFTMIVPGLITKLTSKV